MEGASTLRLAPGGAATLIVRNGGTGVLTFVAVPSQPWLKAEPWQSVALGRDLGGVAAVLTIRAEAVIAAAEELSLTGEVRIEAPTATGAPLVIPVVVSGAPAQTYRSFIPGVSKD